MPGVTGPTACTFDGTGRITVAGTNIIFNGDAAGTLLNSFTLSGGSRVFAGIPNGSQETIQSLGPEPVGSTFPAIPFIAFPLGGQSQLQINFIQAGKFSTLTCGGVPAAGQTCTPALPSSAPGPFSFSNFNDPNFGLSSTVTFIFSGVSADGAAKWSTIFTSQFLGQPFQAVLNQLTTTGTVSSAYSQATLVVPSAPDLTIAKSHTGNFTQSQNGAAYTLKVTNGGTAATSGTMTVTDTLPAGLTFVSGSGGGFTCSAVAQVVTCTSTTAIAPAAMP